MTIFSISETVRLLQSGGVAIVPTDSCYGLAGDAMRKDVFQRVLTLKGRPAKRPPAIFIPDLETCDTLITLNETLRKQIAALLPGAVTVLLNPRSDTPPWLCDPRGRIGIRMISHKPLSDIIQQAGLILTATSANRTGDAPPYTMDELMMSPLISTADGVLAGSCGGLQPSTVIDLTSPSPTLIREGPIAFLEVIQQMEGEQK